MPTKLKLKTHSCKPNYEEEKKKKKYNSYNKFIENFGIIFWKKLRL